MQKHDDEEGCPLVKKRKLLGDRRAKRITQKKQVQTLQHQVYELAGFLSKAKRNCTVPLPWEEVAQALKDDMLEKVRDNRSLKTKIEMNKRLYDILREWVVNITLHQTSPDAHTETWRHTYLPNGDAACRLNAQRWILDQAFFNTQRAFGHATFPDTFERCIDVQIPVTVDDKFYFQVKCMAQIVLPYSLEQVSDAYWVAENTFTSYRRDRKLPTLDEYTRLQRETLLYTYEEEPNDAHQQIRRNCLHGRFRDSNRTTIVCRMLLHDEAFPLPHSRAWTMDIKQWTVIDRMGPTASRLRIFYTIDHPQTTLGLVPIEDIAYAFDLPCDGHLKRELCQRITIVHKRQRDLFYEHLEKLVSFHAV